MKNGPSGVLRLVGALVLTGTATIAAVAGETPDRLEQPCAGFETHHLTNGLRVWYRHLPDAARVSLSVVVPYGSDQDPPGKEELAHFLEHMLFSDHRGRSEEEIKREIEDRGGERNGSTSGDRSLYWVTIDREHGMLALDWLSRIVEPHAMEPEVVERGREPVALENHIRPLELFDYIRRYYIQPVWLPQPGFWKREFALPTRGDRAYDPYESLYSIEPEDLRAFYDTYYVPSRMTLIVVGALERAAVLERAEATFGQLASRPVPNGYPEPRNPGRSYRRYGWDFRADVSYQTGFKIYGMTSQDHVRLLFLRRFLRNRLRQRLRFGKRKAVYSVSVSLTTRGPATYLRIAARIREAQLGHAKAIIEEELENLRSAGYTAEDWEVDRSAVVRQFVGDHRTAAELNDFVADEFHDRDLHEDVPPVVQSFARLEQGQLAELASRLLVEPNRVHWETRPHPVSQGFFALCTIGLAFLVVRLAGALLPHSAPMRRIRYVARFHRPLLYRILVTPIWLAGVAILFRLASYGFDELADRFVEPYPVYLYQGSVFAAGFGATIFALILVLGATPVKILVFDDHLLVKSRSFRSRRIERREIAGIGLKRLPELLRAQAPWRTRWFALGLWRPAVYLECRRGFSYFFRARDNRELIEVIEELTAAGDAAPPDPASSTS